MSAKKAQLVILGGGYAGILAALRLSRLTRDRAEVTLVNAAPDFFERVRFHERAAGHALRQTPIAPLLAQVGARLLVGRASALDTARREVVVDGARVGYDRLVYALGSASIAVPNTITVEDPACAALVAQAQSVIVVGGGLTAVEAAAEFAEARPGQRVTLVSARGVSDCLTPRAQRRIRAGLLRLGVEVIDNTAVLGVEPGRAMTAAGPLAADVVVWAAGFRASPLAAEAGLPVDENGRVLVDATLHALGVPDVVVAGDAASVPLAQGCKTAMPMGAHAAAVVAAELDGRTPAPHTFGDTGVCVSLGRRDGVVDLRRRDGTPRNIVLSGWLGTFVKERVARYTRWSLVAEAADRWRYRWLRGRQALLAPPPPRPELAA